VRLEKCVYRGVGPFADEWCLDLTRFTDDQKMIALVGVNGRGKSFSWEAALLGAIYREMPTQGTLIDRAKAADSLLESTIVHKGKRWTIKHVIDALQSTSSVVVSGPDGPLWKKAGPKVFKTWVEENLPEKSVVLASLFSHQSSEGFVQMTSGERIAVLLRVIGVERLERKAKLAREFASAEKKKLDDVLRRIADVRGDVPAVDVAQSSLDAATLAAAAADDLVAKARAALALRQAEASAHAVRKTAHEAATTLRKALRDQAEGARARVAAAEAALAAARAVQGEAAAIRAAAEALPAEELALADLRAAWAAADGAVRAELDPWRDGAQRLAAARQRQTSAEGRLRDEQAVLAAVGGKDALKAAAEAERAAVAALGDEIKALEATRWAGADERAGELRLALTQASVQQTYEDTHREIHHGLDKDDATLRAATETPKEIKTLAARLAAEQAHLAAAERKLADAEKLAARAGDLEAARADLAAATSEVSSLVEGQAQAVVTALVRAVGRLDVAIAGREQAAKLEPLRALAKRLPQLEASELRVAELEPQVAEGKAELDRLGLQIGAVELVDLGQPPDVASAERALAQAEPAAKAAHEAATRAAAGLARSEEVEARVEGLEDERAAIEVELADWTRAALDHGRGGMQAAEVDNAGPELTTYINDLLRNCVGTRWTMYVQTQHLDADGKKMVEGCEIRVIDNQTGEDKEVSEHSGGERKTLAEAISSGLTMLGCSRMGFDRPTLVRDESDNFLDPAAALQWVRMMRHVIKFTNADRLLFVSHNPEVVRLADATIEPPARRIVEIGAAA